MVPRIEWGRIAHKTDETRKGLKPINSSAPPAIIGGCVFTDQTSLCSLLNETDN